MGGVELIHRHAQSGCGLGGVVAGGVDVLGGGHGDAHAAAVVRLGLPKMRTSVSGTAKASASPE